MLTCNTAIMNTYIFLFLTAALIASCESRKIEKRSIVNRFTNNPLFLSHFSGTGYDTQYSSDPWAYNSQDYHQSYEPSPNFFEEETEEQPPKVQTISEYINSNKKTSQPPSDKKHHLYGVPTSNKLQEFKEKTTNQQNTHSSLGDDEGIIYIFKSLPLYDPLPNFLVQPWVSSNYVANAPYPDYVPNNLLTKEPSSFIQTDDFIVLNAADGNNEFNNFPSETSFRHPLKDDGNINVQNLNGLYVSNVVGLNNELYSKRKVLTSFPKETTNYWPILNGGSNFPHTEDSSHIFYNSYEIPVVHPY